MSVFFQYKASVPPNAGQSIDSIIKYEEKPLSMDAIHKIIGLFPKDKNPIEYALTATVLSSYNPAYLNARRQIVDVLLKSPENLANLDIEELLAKTQDTYLRNVLVNLPPHAEKNKNSNTL